MAYKVCSSEEAAGIYGRLVSGIKEYMADNGFSKTVIGLSGGVDSAVVCCLAAAAAGKENVVGIAMPSRYSSSQSLELAASLACGLDICFKTIEIDDIYSSYLMTLGKHFDGKATDEVDIYKQNIQSRIRGNILMAFSNRFGHLVLTTGNRSEAMMGYCTLYGDTAGGLAVLSNVFKTDVYALAEIINRNEEVIPIETIKRVPSAELKPGQKDEDSLPPYDILDEILYLYLDEKLSRDEIVKKGLEAKVVDSVIAGIKLSEYKRRQSPAGISV